VFLLLAATLLQMRSLLADFIQPRAVRYWEVRSLAAWERSALLSEGQDFTDYVTFLRETLPESGKVVLPSSADIGEAGPFTSIAFMQYFLFPRVILNCSEPIEECLLTMTGPASYVLRVGGPQPSVEHKTYVPFRDDRGVYVPK
jgi:hypothetical protein